MHPNAMKRNALLKTLYAARAAKPEDGWLPERDLKDAHGEVAFSLDVLVEVGQVKRDGFRYRITGAGVLAHEEAGAP